MDLMSLPEDVKLVISRGNLIKLMKYTIGHDNSSKKEDDEFISLKDVMVITGLAKQTIYGRVSKGTIPYYKAPDGKRLRFKKSEILVWLDSGRKNKPDAEIEQEVKAYIKSKKIGQKSW
jgi:excisionase family DNA binding protein